VVGLPDEKWGEAPHAFVVLRADARATEEEVRQFARSHLAQETEQTTNEQTTRRNSGNMRDMKSSNY